MSWQFDELLNQARRAEEAGDLWVARNTLRRALELEAADIPTLIWYGDLSNQLEQFAEAIATFEQALALDQTFAGAFSGLATALVETGRLEEAERALLESVRLRPTSSRFVLLADVQIDLGKTSMAEVSLRRALTLNPNDDEALYNLAVLVREHDPEQAIQLFSRAIGVDPRYAAAYRELGATYLAIRALAAAETAIQSALELDAEDARTHLYLGQLLQQQQQPQRAQAAYERARALSPLWTLPMVFMGRSLEQEGDLPRAERFFRMAAETDPFDADALAEWGQHLLNRGRLFEAQKALSDALHLEPQHKLALLAMEKLRSALADQ